MTDTGSSHMFVPKNIYSELSELFCKTVESLTKEQINDKRIEEPIGFIFEEKLIACAEFIL